MVYYSSLIFSLLLPSVCFAGKSRRLGLFSDSNSDSSSGSGSQSKSSKSSKEDPEPTLSSGKTLLDAIDAAFVRTVKSGEYFNFLAPVDYNILPSDCYTFVDFYPFPTLSGEPSALEEVLDRGSVRIALPVGGSDYGVTLPPGVPIPPYGAAIDLFESLVGQIGANYNVPLTVDYVPLFGNDATFSAVNEGTADLVAPFAAIGGLVDVGNGDVRRRSNFAASCGIFASEMQLVVRKNEFGSIQDLRDVDGRVCAYVQFTGIVTSLFENPDLIRTQTVAEAESICLGNLAAQTTDAYLTDSTNEIDTDVYEIIGTGVAPATSFFSRL